MRIATIDGSEYDVDDEVFEHICRLELEISTSEIEKGRYKDMFEIKKHKVEELEVENKLLREENAELLANDDGNCEIQRQLMAEVERLRKDSAQLVIQNTQLQQDLACAAAQLSTSEAEVERLKTLIDPC